MLAVGLERFGRFWRVLDVIINPVNNVPFLASPPCLLPPFSSSCLFSFSLSPSIRLFFLFLPSSSTGTSLKRARHARKNLFSVLNGYSGHWNSLSVLLQVKCGVPEEEETVTESARAHSYYLPPHQPQKKNGYYSSEQVQKTG